MELFLGIMVIVLSAIDFYNSKDKSTQFMFFAIDLFYSAMIMGYFNHCEKLFHVYCWIEVVMYYFAIFVSILTRCAYEYNKKEINDVKEHLEDEEIENTKIMWSHTTLYICGAVIQTLVLKNIF